MNEINQLFIRSNFRSLNGVATCAELQEGGGGSRSPLEYVKLLNLLVEKQIGSSHHTPPPTPRKLRTRP